MRRRNPKEIIAFMGDKTEETIELIKGDHRYSQGKHEDYEEEVLELLELLKKMDEQEIKDAQEVIGSENAVEEFLEIHKDIEKAEKFLENRNKEALLKYLNRILRVERKLYNEIDIQTFDDIEIKKSLGGGIEGVAYLTGDNHVLKQWSPKHTDVIDLKRLKNQIDQVPKTVNIARILKVGLYHSSPATLMEKAPGIPVSEDYDNHSFQYHQWRETNEKLAKAPISHYNKLKKDMDILQKHNIGVDTVKPDNIFYHDESGFTFIDISRSHSRVKKKFKVPYSDNSAVLMTLTGLEAYVEWIKWIRGHPKRSNKNPNIGEDFEILETIVEKLLEVGFQRYDRFDKYWSELQNLK